MNSFAVEVWDDETEKVKFYSVRQENAKYLEVDRFLLRMCCAGNETPTAGTCLFNY